MAVEISVLGATVDTTGISPALRSAANDIRRFARGAQATYGNVTASVTRLTGSIFNLRNSILALASGAVIGSAINENRKFEESISDLSAITGAAGEDLEFLSEKAKEFGSTTTLSSTQAAEAFKLVASAKPDLLENGEALATVTKEAITLAEASGSTLPDAARTLGSALNQFGADADQAGRFINVLAAGAQRGASEIADTAEALKASGVVASAASVSFEELNGAIQTLATVGVKGQEAGTALRNVILKLRNQGVDDLDPAVQGLAGAIRNLGEANLSVTELTKLFGLENIAAAQALLDNVDKVEQLTTAITGTDIAYEQASVKVDNLSGDLKTFRSAVELAQIEVGEGLNPSIRDATQFATALTRAIVDRTKPALDDMEESGSALGDTLFTIGRVGARGFGVLADGIQGIRILVKGVEIAFEGAKGAVIIFAGVVADEFTAIGERINAIIGRVEAISRVFGEGLDLSNLRVDFSLASQTFDQALEDNAESLRNLRTELQNLLLEELPSEVIQREVERIAAATRTELDRIRSEFAQDRTAREAAADVQGSTAAVTEGLKRNAEAATSAALATEQLKLGRVRLSKAEKELITLQREGRLLTESLRTAEEVRNDEVERARFLLDRKIITEQTYARAVTEANEALREANKAELDRGRSVDKTKDKLTSLKDTYGDTERAIVSMARNGQVSFENFAQAVISDILEIIFQTERLSGIQGGRRGGGGLIGSIFSGIFGLFGGSGVGSAAAAAATGPELFFAKGGRTPTGSPIVVGERGPEVFVPDVNGRVVPNAGGMGATQQFFMSANITVESMDPSNAADVVERALPQITATFDGLVQQAFERRLRQGPMG